MSDLKDQISLLLLPTLYEVEVKGTILGINIVKKEDFSNRGLLKIVKKVIFFS